MKVQIPGVAWQRVADGDFPNEVPKYWALLNESSHHRKYGKSGFAQIVTGDSDELRKALDDMRDYMDGVAGAMWSALGDQLGDPDAYHSVRIEASSCTLACQRITEALGDDWKPRL